MEFKDYDHSLEDFYGACGMTEEQAEATTKAANDAVYKAIEDGKKEGKEGVDLSRLVESYDKHLNKRQIAVILVQIQDELAQMKQAMSSLFASSDKVGEA